MSTYMSRLFPRSNSSIFLCSGQAIKADALRLREQTWLVDAGIGSPRICTQDETSVTGKGVNRFEDKVGFLDSGAGGGESLVRKRILERFFVDLVSGDSLIKERAAVRFNDLLGSRALDVVAGEPTLLNPRRFRQTLVWLELNRLRRSNSTVRGFYIDKVRGGYSVAIAGYVAFLPYNRFTTRLGRNLSNDRFTIENIERKSKSVVVF
ncbi:ribosomal protein S1, mitochondrial-like [Hibiscus syriacus]|uniref:ribosomal protein S1, mitochondrial-like n=1 Tax=Hibiscus syriacus TaxID=106335 RepID=UPI0019238D65|nr:ribosomal protein S1, mitochondrial-like [Hibiscus syriacus]